MRSGAELVVEGLERAGVRYVFGYPGGQNARFIEAMHGSAVEFVLVTHEACAGFMADVYGRLTGRPGACLSTLGPGATNMTTGVGNAYLDRVPVLAFTAKMGSHWRGRTVQMQIDHQRLYAPITKWTTELEPGTIPATIRRAVEVATAEQPGPVHLDFPEDVAESPADELPKEPPAPVRAARADLQSIERARAMIGRARYPLVALGLTMNRAGATREVREFIEKHRLPVVTTMMAKGHVAENGSHLVGVVGRARRDIVAEYTAPADLVIAIGYDPIEFNYEDWVGKDVPIVHIDTVAGDVPEDRESPLQLVGDIRLTMEQLRDLPPLPHHWDMDALAGHRRKLYAALTPAQEKFSPHHAVLAMRELLPADGLLTVDVGAHTHLIAQLWAADDPGRLMVSNGWSSMGFAIPAAVAAKLVQPTRPVVACMGDGGFLMMVGEIATAVRLRLPVVFVLLRDRFLSLIRVKQTRKHYHHDGVDLLGADYRPADTLFGARVEVARTEEEFRDAFKRGLEGGEPCVLEAVVDPAEYDVVL